jgi:tetratricopeptide (TPR) repeat protein
VTLTRFAVPLLISLSLAATACGTTRDERVARDLSTFHAERTPDKLVARGAALAQIGDLTRAEQYLAAALDEGADPSVVLPKLLRICISAGHQRAAINYAAPQLRKHPGDVWLRFVVAELRALTGDTAGARSDLERVVAAEPLSSAPHLAMARLLRDQLGDVITADREFRAYLRLAPDGEHAEEARASLLQAVVARPASPTPEALP